jgi:16S rRNA C967 or C1407 C5-methylase (RsmB/RsmF family)/NOL1/NOP2/fmu family ribosome biogenesis protein
MISRNQSIRCIFAGSFVRTTSFLMLPPPFIAQMQRLLGDEACTAFRAALAQPVPVSIRLNPHKVSEMAGLHEIEPLAPVPWHPQGYYLEKRPVFTLDPALHAGAYYVQEASSMFLQEALRQVADFTKPLKILDLCAAPGGKSTLLASMLAGKGLLVANETIRSRTNALRENLEKWGHANIAVTSAEAEAFSALDNYFDVVVVDAPCSGEGLFRKDPNAVSEWSLEAVSLCSARQKRILESAVECLAPGGILVFSTCTYNSAENGDNVQWLSSDFGLELLPLDIPGEWGIEPCGGGYQFFPHRLRGEGFFIAVFRKMASASSRKQNAGAFRSLSPLSKAQAPEASRWLHPEADVKFFQTTTGNVLALPTALENNFLLLDKHLKIKWFGVLIGEFKGKDFVPDHALALSLLASAQLPGIELSLEQALRFLKKETFELPAGSPTGWLLCRYGGLNLGWIKALPNRMNNYLPPERRIRMELK